MDRHEWIAACAHQLQRRWRTVDPEMLEDVAADLWADDALRGLAPTQAATEWLRPVAQSGDQAAGTPLQRTINQTSLRRMNQGTKGAL